MILYSNENEYIPVTCNNMINLIYMILDESSQLQKKKRKMGWEGGVEEGRKEDRKGKNMYYMIPLM